MSKSSTRANASSAISAVPTPRDDVQKLDESERQLGGSTEHAAGVDRASDLDVQNAARKLGSPVDMQPLQVFDDVTEVNLGDATIIRGPGRIENGVWRHTFDKPGRTAIIYSKSADDGTVDYGAFVVEHGAIVEAGKFHRGAIFAFLGDTDALGWSFTYKRPVWELLFGPPCDERCEQSYLAGHILHFGRVQNTVLLMLPALLLSLLIAIPLGAWAAMRRGTFADRFVNALSITLLSMPAFWLGIIFVLIFAARFHVLPATGIGTPGINASLAEVVPDRLRHMILPVSVLALVYAGQWIRYVRSGMLEVLPQDFVRTARAKGLAPVDVARHALKNALIPLITVIALATPQLFGGALLTETVFAWPGVGRLQYEAVLNNDSYVAIVVFLVSASLVMFANLIADALYVVVDPRLRRGGS
jgi:peptide/nickel transport system permease protein